LLQAPDLLIWFVPDDIGGVDLLEYIWVIREGFPSTTG
jgi:hypothetical protein